MTTNWLVATAIICTTVVAVVDRVTSTRRRQLKGDGQK